MRKIRFTVETIKSGQPRPYADTEREYLVTVEVETEPWMVVSAQRQNKELTAGEWTPWLMGGEKGDQKSEWFLKWCDGVVRGTCQNFFRKGSDPGANWASPILQWMRTDPVKGTIHVFITEAYTD